MLEFLGEVFASNMVFQVCFALIALSFGFACWSEYTVTKRFTSRIKQWQEIIDDIDENNIDGDYKHLSLIQRYFVIKGWSNNKAQLAKTTEDADAKILVNLPPVFCLPEKPTSPNRFVPALLTSIGVLGTFTGITLGLSAFETTGNSEQLLTSASTLMDGMRSAFATSLTGLSFAAITMLLLSNSDRRRKNLFDRTLSDLSVRVLPMSSTTLLFGLYETQYEISQQQLSAAITMGKAAETIADSLNRLDQTLDQLRTPADHATESFVEDSSNSYFEDYDDSEPNLPLEQPRSPDEPEGMSQ